MKNSLRLNFYYGDLVQTQVLSESLRSGSDIKKISRNYRNNIFLNWNSVIKSVTASRQPMKLSVCQFSTPILRLSVISICAYANITLDWENTVPMGTTHYLIFEVIHLKNTSFWEACIHFSVYKTHLPILQPKDLNFKNFQIYNDLHDPNSRCQQGGPQQFATDTYNFLWNNLKFWRKPEKIPD